MSPSRSPRWINMILGAWLFVSAFLWDHTVAQFNNSWIIGLAAIVAAAIAVRFDKFRYANTVLSVWLFISAWALPVVSIGTVWNNLIVSVLMFMTSLAPQTPRVRTTTRPSARGEIGGPTSQRPISAHR